MPATAAWLSRCGWSAGAVLVMSAAPAVLPAAPGRLSPAGLVLWGPVSTVLGAAPATITRPSP